MERIRKFYRDTSGASAVEYGLLIGFIAMAVIGGVSVLGQTVSGLILAAANAFPA